MLYKIFKLSIPLIKGEPMTNKKFIDKHAEEQPTVLSAQQTLLAAERTFFALIRTALSAIAGGVAILRLIEVGTSSHTIADYIIGETLIIWACALMIMAYVDYRKIQKQLIAHKKGAWRRYRFFILLAPLLMISVLLIWVTLS